MNTTAIFVELLVIGIQTALWVILLFGSLLPQVTPLSDLSKWEGLVTAGAFAVCYSLGILVDRIADLFFVAARPKDLIISTPWLSRLRGRISNQKIDTSSLQVAFKEGKALEYLDYFRVRIRITRALAINSFLATIALSLYGARHWWRGIDLWLFIPIVCLVGGGVSVFSFFAVGALDLANSAQKVEIERLMQEKSQSS